MQKCTSGNARGFTSKWKQQIFYDFNTKVTRVLLFRVIKKLEGRGFIVVAVVSGMGGSNQGLWKSLSILVGNVSFSNPPDRNECKIQKSINPLTCPSLTWQQKRMKHCVMLLATQLTAPATEVSPMMFLQTKPQNARAGRKGGSPDKTPRAKVNVRHVSMYVGNYGRLRRETSPVRTKMSRVVCDYYTTVVP
ncbi:hypothetical protein PR048_010096, partial [Dryococelus australis]